MRELPSGTVTFLFTDIEGSTRLLHELGDGYAEALAEHRRVLREAFERHGGVEVDTQGDAFFVAFEHADHALAAATEAHAALDEGPVRIRVGIHTGESQVGDEGYVGLEVHRAARIGAAAHGGQTVLSQATRELADGDVLDLGEHRLKDFDEPVWLFQLGTKSFPPLRTLASTNLPRPASSFVGRAGELDELVELLDSDARLVTLTGPGGSGKTRLAIEAAAQLVGDYPNGVFWIPLAPLRDPALVLETVAQSVGARQDLASHFAGKRALLLLDNFEQVIDAAAELSDLLRSCRGLEALVTSRELLRVDGECEYPVQPLVESEAVELFAARAGIDPDGTIEELCRRLDNLPLAVELAAARASVLSPTQILERLSQRLDLLRGGRDADSRHSTLRATIDWSHDLLDPPERILFARLAVFAGGCTLEAAQDVCEADLDTLQSLVEKSLVRRSGGRFWMLETIREFAAGRLEESGEAGELRDRHAAWVAALVDEVSRTRALRRLEPEAVARLAPEHDNVRQAIAWSIEGGDPGVGSKLIGTLCVYWVYTGRAREGVALAERLLGVDQLTSAERLAGISGAAELFRSTGDEQRAIALMEEALGLLNNAGDEPIELPGFIESRDQWKISLLKDLAQTTALVNEFATARAYASEALREAEVRGDELEIAFSVSAEAFVEFLDGRYEQARELAASTLPTWTRYEFISEAALTHLTVGECYRREGRMRDAVPELLAALEACTQGEQSLLYEVLQELAPVAISHERPDVAVRLLGASDSLRREAGLSPWDPGDFELTVDSLRRTLGDAVFERQWQSGAVLTREAAIDLVHTVDQEVVSQ
jgi:predicted ATPase/class 3 adenylate cyclase